MFNVDKETYTIKFNQQKFKKLPPGITVGVIKEIVGSFDINKEGLSNKSLKSLFVIGLENETTGKRVGFDEAASHYERLIERSDINLLRKIITVRFVEDMPDFIKLGGQGWKKKS